VLRRPLEPGQYTSIDYTHTLADHGVLASVGSVGDAYDTHVGYGRFAAGAGVLTLA
jgi:hypothetical protein